MRTGRPAFHIKAKWVTIDQPNGSYFFELDDKGRLKLRNGLVQPHRFVPNPPAAPPADLAPQPPATPPREQQQKDAAEVESPQSIALEPSSVWDAASDFSFFDEGDLQFGWV
jgi:hypothetical protein